MDLYLTVEDCIIRNYEAKGMYLTNTKKLVLDTCTFEDNANNFGFLKGQGDFAVDLNLCAVQDAEITIENCTFKGDNGLTAPIKIAARGGTDDQESDIKEAGAATIESVIITGCKFADLLPRMKWLNFGGGHHITRPGYALGTLESCILARAASSPIR